MTDQERARAFSDRWGRDAGPLLVTAEERDLAEEFAAVRTDERRAIAAWLRDRTGWIVDPAVADRIERGEHAL